ncbi:MAG TPA: transcriptional regulator [Jatrophihabitans sp.]|nr:transcriptional regulator [Jatrophihabitans sp.]
MTTVPEPTALPTGAAIRAVAALEDSLRQAIYEFIRGAHHPVSREEAAEAVGISRKLAAFHLDKLVSAGLLRSDFAPAGLRKVGRAPKMYSPVNIDVHISLPERHHEVLAAILIDGVLSNSNGETAIQAVLRAARERGRSLASAERDQLRPGRLGAERALTVSSDVLKRHGYEPDRVSPTRLCLRNCPFHPASRQATELVCGLNQAYLSGFLDGLDAQTVEAALQPRPGECCVELRATGQRGPAAAAGNGP